MNPEQQAIASRIRPVAEPRILDGVYSENQYQRMLGVVRDRGPWQLILAQHFASAQEVVATLSGALPEGVEPSFDHFLTSNFRGYFAKHGTCLYPELEDCFFNSKFLDLVRDYWKAEYARPDNMLFNINGPCDSHDPAHLDGDVALSGGNFHAEPVAFAADILALAICEIGSIAERRVAMLIDPALSGLPAFLTPEPGLNSGFMIPQVTAAALVSEVCRLSRSAAREDGEVSRPPTSPH